MRKIDVQNFQRATRDTPREVNRRIILNLMREHGPISRADLARLMDVPRGMVTALINELLADGLVFEGATATAPRGRKPTLLHVSNHNRLAIGIDIRGSGTVIQLRDFAGEQHARETCPTPHCPQAFADELAERVRALIAESQQVGTCEGIGLVVPGMADNRAGTILNAPTLGWRDVDLGRALAALVDVPVHIERDAVACALARIWLDDRAHEELHDFVYLVVSEGVGTGLVVNGQPVRGTHSTAGEFGHVPLNVDGPLCSCGGRGCLEAYASDTATLARYLQREFTGRDTTAAMRDSGVSVSDLVRSARAGDDRAHEALTTTGRYLGIGLASIINALNPARIIVGGEITGAWDLLEPLLRASICEHTLTSAAAATPIEVDPRMSETRLRGAAALVVAPAFAAPAIA